VAAAGAVAQQRLDVAVSEQDRKEIQTELGEVLEKQMGQTDQGISYYKRALDVDPHFVPALEALERIYAERGQNDELVDILEAKERALTGAERDREHEAPHRRALRDDARAGSERAGQVYREVLEVEPSNLQGDARSRARLRRAQQWPELVGVLEMQLDVVRRSVSASIADEDRAHPGGALPQARPGGRAARAGGRDRSEPRGGVRGLERCYRKLRQWLDLINTYDRHISATLDRAKKIDL
jgi:golgin subfamily B member 1